MTRNPFLDEHIAYIIHCINDADVLRLSVASSAVKKLLALLARNSGEVSITSGCISGLWQYLPLPHVSRYLGSASEVHLISDYKLKNWCEVHAFSFAVNRAHLWANSNHRAGFVSKMCFATFTFSIAELQEMQAGDGHIAYSSDILVELGQGPRFQVNLTCHFFEEDGDHFTQLEGSDERTGDAFYAVSLETLESSEVKWTSECCCEHDGRSLMNFEKLRAHAESSTRIPIVFVARRKDARRRKASQR